MKFAIILLLAVIFLPACVVNPTTGEKKFAPLEVISSVDEAIPDETKAVALEELAIILGATGAGAVGAPLCYGAAAYFRNRKKKGKQTDGDKVE